jgi:hypothetical protein
MKRCIASDAAEVRRDPEEVREPDSTNLNAHTTGAAHGHQGNEEEDPEQERAD